MFLTLGVFYETSLADISILPSFFLSQFASNFTAAPLWPVASLQPLESRRGFNNTGRSVTQSRNTAAASFRRY
jgi:hypothetical protein